MPRLIPRLTSAQAFATDYGARLVDQLARNLDASVDRACLAERRIAAPSRERAADLLTRYGARVIELDEAYMEARGRLALPAFIASSGAEAPAELNALRQQPHVRELLATLNMGQLDNLAEGIAEALDDHLASQAAPLVRRLSPHAAGVSELIAMRERRDDAAREAIERFIAEHSSVPEVQRFNTLMEAWYMAILGAEAPERNSHRGFEGIVAELRANCVRLP